MGHGGGATAFQEKDARLNDTEEVPYRDNKEGDDIVLGVKTGAEGNLGLTL